MQFRGLLVAVGVLALLGAGVFFSDKYKKDEEKKGKSDSSSAKVVTIPEDQIAKIEIERKDGTKTVLEKADKWKITAPEAFNADQDSVNSVVTAVSSVGSDRVVEENTTDFATFGLAGPQLTVTAVKKDGGKSKLLIGDETATGNGFYARLDGQSKVHIIGSSSKTSLDKTAQDLRDKRLIAFDADKLSRVELSTKGDAIEFGKNQQNEWQIVKPKPLRADNWGVEELVRKIKDAKMDTAVTADEAKKIAGNFASGTKVAVVRVTDASGTQELEVRKKDKDFFAKGSAVAGMHKVTSDLGEGLNKSLNDLRNKKLFDFGFNDPSRVEVTLEGGSGKSYEKQGDKWMLGKEQMDSVSVQSLIDRLRDISSTKFADSGFTSPSIEIKVVAKEGKLTDQVQISKNGSSYFAVRKGEPSVYELDGNGVEELKKAAGDIKAPAPPAKDAKKDEKKKK